MCMHGDIFLAGEELDRARELTGRTSEMDIEEG
jgi:hypothetical protein